MLAMQDDVLKARCSGESLAIQVCRPVWLGLTGSSVTQIHHTKNDACTIFCVMDLCDYFFQSAKMFCNIEFCNPFNRFLNHRLACSLEEKYEVVAALVGLSNLDQLGVLGKKYFFLII